MYRERGVRPYQRGCVELTDDREAKISRRWVGFAVGRGARRVAARYKLEAVDDLNDPVGARAMTEINPIVFAERTVQLGRFLSRGPRLLTDKAVVTDVNRSSGVAQVEDLGHAVDAPTGHAGDEVGDAGVTFPVALVRVVEPHRRRAPEHGVGWVSNVPYLVRLPAEAPQQEYPLDISWGDAGQIGSVANADHLSAASLTDTTRTGEVTQVDGVGGVGDINDRSAVVLDGICERIQGRATMVAEVGYPPAALLVHEWLIGGTVLKIVEAH